MTKRDILESIINHYCGGKKAKFAEMIGTRPQTISGWLARDYFDIELIFSKCENLSAHYLLTGEGPLLRTETGHDTAKSEKSATADLQRRVRTIEGHDSELQERVEALEAQIAGLSLRCDRLVKTLACIATP